MQLEDEKIDKDIIPLMEDNDLAKYFSAYGDRLAIKNWCKSETSTTRKKSSLFEKLKTKMEQTRNKTTRNKSNVEHSELPGPAKKRGKANQRKIEIGWINCEKGQLKQVRAKQGGGDSNC